MDDSLESAKHWGSLTGVAYIYNFNCMFETGDIGFCYRLIVPIHIKWILAFWRASAGFVFIYGDEDFFTYHNEPVGCMCSEYLFIYSSRTSS